MMHACRIRDIAVEAYDKRQNAIFNSIGQDEERQWNTEIGYKSENKNKSYCQDILPLIANLYVA